MTATTEKMDEHYPMQAAKVSSKYLRYMSQLLKILLQITHKIKSARGTQKLKETDRRIHDTIIAIIKSAKKHGSAPWWKTTNYMLGKWKGCSTALDLDVEEMNQCFANVCRDEDYQPPRNTDTRETPPLEVSPHLLYGVLRKTRDTAPGKNGIPAWVFRENAHNLIFPLKHIIDNCLAQGKFPTCLKKSKGYPLLKVATPGSLNDLRHIAITAFMSRIMERIMIRSWVATNYKRVQGRERGFRVGRSTENALIRLQIDCHHFQSVGNDYVRIISLYFSKAIDKAKHDLLVEKHLWVPISLTSHKLIR